MTRRIFFGLIPALLAAAKWPIEKLRPKVQKFTSFMVYSPYESTLRFERTVLSFDPTESFRMVGKVFRLETIKTIRTEDGQWLVSIDFAPLPAHLHVEDLSKAELRKPWPKNPHRSESEDDAAFPVTWLENKLRSEMNDV